MDPSLLLDPGTSTRRPFTRANGTWKQARTSQHDPRGRLTSYDLDIESARKPRPFSKGRTLRATHISRRQIDSTSSTTRQASTKQRPRSGRPHPLLSVSLRVIPAAACIANYATGSHVHERATYTASLAGGRTAPHRTAIEQQQHHSPCNGGTAPRGPNIAEATRSLLFLLL